MTSRLVGVLGLGFVLALASPLACSSFNGAATTDSPDGSSPYSDADGGDGPGITGSADVGIDIQVGTAGATSYVIQGGQLSIPVTLTRKPSSSGAVTVTIVGTLPAKVTAAPLVIPANATDGSLVLNADTNAVQTKFKVQVLASESAGASAVADLNGFVRGMPGSLDTTFGTNGVVRNIFGAKNAMAVDIVVLSDDRTAVVGANGSAGDQGTSWAAMFSPDGVFDTSYGTAGYGALAISCLVGQAVSDNTGRILFAGNGLANSMLIGRLTAQGQADPDYGNLGGVIPVSTGAEQIGGTGGPIEGSPVSLARPDGTAIVSYQAAIQMGPFVGLRAFDVHGSPISGFGTSGAVVGPKINTGGTPISGIRSNGDIWTLFSDGSYTHVAEHAGDTGAVVAGFGDILTDSTPSGVWTAHSAATLSDSSIVFAVGSGASVVMARFVSDGTHIDPAYGTDQGRFTMDGAALPSITADSLSRVIVGLSVDGAGIRVARITPAGAYDTTFATGGTLTHNFGTNQKLTSIAQQKDGRIVVVGQEDVSGGTDATLSRYWP